jgi:hypothetical protein
MTDRDETIRRALAEIVAASPAPPDADDLRTSGRRPRDGRARRRRAQLLTAGAAAAVAVAVVVAVVAVTGGDDEVAVRTDPTATTAGPTTAPPPSTAPTATTGLAASPDVAALLARPVALPNPGSVTRCPVTAPTTDVIPNLANVVGQGTGRAAGIVGGAVTVGDPGNGEWWGGKVLFAVDPAVEGPVVVRGGLVGGSDDLGFGQRPAPVEPQFVIPALSAAGSEATQATIPGSWRAEPAEVRVAMPGCYAVQIDTATSSDVIVFRATPEVPDGPVERAELDPLPADATAGTRVGLRGTDLVATTYASDPGTRCLRVDEASGGASNCGAVTGSVGPLSGVGREEPPFLAWGDLSEDVVEVELSVHETGQRTVEAPVGGLVVFELRTAPGVPRLLVHLEARTADGTVVGSHDGVVAAALDAGAVASPTTDGG